MVCFCGVSRRAAVHQPHLRGRILDELQRESFSYFLHETNHRNGLVRDKTRKGWPASIAAVGMALAADPVGVDRGFLKYRWEGYDEALILYILGLGSPTFPLPQESYDAWLSTYSWRKIYGYELVHAGPLFVHQMSHLWIDFRGIRDRYMRQRGLDYFENSRRATYVQQEYAVRHPHDFEGYSRRCWGLTASEGPGPKTLKVDGVWRRFYDYVAR